MQNVQQASLADIPLSIEEKPSSHEIDYWERLGLPSLGLVVERTGNNTRAGVIVSLMQSAPVHDTRMENYAATVANQAVVPTLLIGGAVLAFTGDLNRATALITLDLGTGIRISVPTTILSALT